MADACPTSTTSRPAPLLERLLTEGWKFDFFQAVWLLERYCGGQLPVGDRGPVAGEAFRFRPDVSLGFPPTDVRRITRHDDPGAGAGRFLVEVTFMGLYGVSTPLPVHYAVDVLRTVEQHGTTAEGESAESGEDPTAGIDTGSAPVRDFLDVFHHRLISLFYRSWLKYRYDVSFGIPGRDAITDYLLWFIGCAPGYDEAMLGVSPIHLIRYAGVLTQRPRSAAMLEGVLEDYWKEIGVEVQQCAGRWVPLTQDDMNRAGTANCTLGADLTVGEQVYDLSGAFNISVGPMDWATYQSFLPGELYFSQMRSLVQLYCADPLSFNIELRLHAGEVPEMCLSSEADAGRLGLTSWVRTDEIPETSVVFSSTSGGSFEEVGEAAADAAEAVAVG